MMKLEGPGDIPEVGRLGALDQVLLGLPRWEAAQEPFGHYLELHNKRKRCSDKQIRGRENMSVAIIWIWFFPMPM